MSPAEEEAFPLTDTQIADNAVKTLEGFKASGAAKPFFVACGFRETGHPHFPRACASSDIWNKAYESRVILSLCACCADRPHLPFVAPAAKFALYPPSEVKLPADQQPPTGMPRIAWSNSGELFGYNWTATLDPEQYHGLQPGQVLPPEVVLDLRRAYYSAVSHVSAQPFEAVGRADRP